MGAKGSKAKYPAAAAVAPVGAAPYSQFAAPFGAAPYSQFGAPFAAPYGAPLSGYSGYFQPTTAAYPAVGGFGGSAYSAYPASFVAPPTASVLPTAQPFLTSSTLTAPITTGLTAPLGGSFYNSGIVGSGLYDSGFYNSGIVNSGLSLPYAGTYTSGTYTAGTTYGLPATSSFGYAGTYGATPIVDPLLTTASSTIVDYPSAFNTVF